MCLGAAETVNHLGGARVPRRRSAVAAEAGTRDGRVTYAEAEQFLAQVARGEDSDGTAVNDLISEYYDA